MNRIRSQGLLSARPTADTPSDQSRLYAVAEAGQASGRGDPDAYDFAGLSAPADTIVEIRFRSRLASLIHRRLRQRRENGR
jgi:hypothetical protein